MEDEDIYNEDYFSSFSDPLLSKKLLRFSEYPNDKIIYEQMMDSEICKAIYDCQIREVYHNGVRQQELIKPIYYQGRRRSATELKEFRASQQFPLFLHELDQLFTYLNEWIIKQDLKIEYNDRSAIANNGIKSIPAHEEFNRFLARLKSEDFLEFDTDLLGDGKKYLEKLALLIRNNNIDLTFRKNQIINLLSDEGLRRCVGGCLTLLDMAVSNLENYGVYRPEQLISRFFLDILKQSAIRAPKLHGANVVSQISKIIRVDRDIGEIHVFNYLLKRAKRVFNLRFLVLAEDPHISFVTGPYRANPAIREKIDSVFENDYINPIKQKLRTADLVYFISNQLREKLETFSDNPIEKLAQLKLWLSEIGDDPHFIENDFFNDEYKFKLEFPLERTVTERLFNTGWLALDMSRSSRLLNEKHFFFKRNKAQISLSSRPSFTFEAFTSTYRVYYNNLELSWIELDGKKQRILDYIQQEGGFEKLNQFFQKTPPILANSLIQTPHDMSLFFQALAPEDLRLGLMWVENNLSDGFVSPPDQSVVWMYQFSNDAIRYAKILESVDLTTRKRLFLHLIERYQPFLKKLQMILNEVVEIPNTTKTELHQILTRRYALFYEIMNNLLRLGIKDFSRLEFPAFHCKRCFFSLKSPIFTYIIEINFSGCNLDNAVFNTYIRNSQFNSASLAGTRFKKSIVTTSFKQTDLTTVQFLGESFSDLRLDGAKFSTDSFLALVKGTRTPVALFNGADLRQVDFQNRQIQHELGNRVIIFNDALLQNTDLSGLFRKELNIVLMENANLDGANLSKCKLANIHILYTSMRNVITDNTVLSLDQLFKLYQQGNRDFSTDFITDSDPKTNLFNSETLAGARLSLQIFLTLLNNGFTNFDQAQLDSIPSNRRNAYLKNYPTLLTSKTLKDRTQRARLERLELGQRKFQELQQILSETLNHRQISKLHVLNQAELFHSYLFTQKNLEIQGQCVQLTAGFSEAIIRSRQAIYKNNLFVVSQWDKRLIQHKPLSNREQTERNRFLDTLRKFEQTEDGAVRLPSWSYNKGIPIENIEGLIALIDFSKQEFAWHINLIEPNKNTGHVLGVYNIQGKYAYFDSNVGYIDNISDREIFIRFLKRIIKKSYLIHNDIKIYVDQYLPSIEFKQNPIKTDLETALYSILETERQRLSKQDTSSYLVINGQLIERTQLYDIGFSYHHDGNLDLPGRLIDAEMNLNQDFLAESLLLNKFSINNYYFKEHLLKYIQEEKKTTVNNFKGKNKLNFDLQIMRALSCLPNYQMLKNAISTQSLTPLFDMSDSTLERRTRLRSMEKLVKKEVARSQLFITKLEQNQFQKGLMEGLQGIGKKIPVPKALAGLIVTKSLFDIGISLAQNNQQAALLQSLMLTYGLFAEPWVEKSIIKLPKKFAHFVNQYSLTIKISDKVLDAKKIVIPTRIFAGTAANVLDLVSLAQSINKYMEAEYGSKDWRDAIADMTIDTASLLTGAAVVVFQAPFGVGLGAGVILIIIKSGYDGSSLLAEYSAYNLTVTEKVQTFFRGSIGLAVSEQVQYLRNRQDQIDNQANHYWKNLRAMNEKLSLPIVAYGGGLGEYIKDNQQSYREKTLQPINNKIRRINQELGAKGKIPLLTEIRGDTSPGISAILPYDTPSNFKENLSRLTPKKPDDKNSQYFCLPAFRNESIEIENNIMLKKTIPEVVFRCVNAILLVDTSLLNNRDGTEYKQAVIDAEYINDGLIQKIPDFDNIFLIYNGTADFFASSIYGSPTTDTFLIKSAYYSGNITLELETKCLLILEDNSDIRTHNITLLAHNNIGMDVFSEKFNGDIEGRFKTKNFGVVLGRQQKQDKYNCPLPVNNTTLFPMLLEGLGGSLRRPDIYKDCLNVKLYASSHYQMTVNSNNYQRSGWGTVAISIDADQAGKIIITPPTENISDPPLDVQALHFPNLNLLQDSRLSYCHVKNKLVVTKEFVSPLDAHNLETLSIELKNYWNSEKKRSNYVLYDRNDNLIAPLLNNEIINTFQYSSPTNIAECFFPQEFSLHRILNITHKVLSHSTTLQDLFSLVEVEEALEDVLYDSTIIGPFELNPDLKLLNFIDVYPNDYSLTIANSDKNILNLISSENKTCGFYGSKDEDHYFINLHEIRGKKLIKINNYDPDTSIDMLEIRTNHSFYELCIDQTTHVEANNSFLFYILDRYEEAQTSPSAYRPVCAGEFNSSWPHVAVILLQNYLLSDVYQHFEICVSLEHEREKCFIPFLDKDTSPKAVWFFKRYFRNSNNEDEFFELNPSFSDIVVEGDVTRFKAIEREQDLILIRDKKDGSTGYNSLSLWLPQYYLDPARWDLFHIYNTQNATAVHSRMRDLDNRFFREISKIAIDYILLDNNLRFYTLPLIENNSIITHNQLQSNPFNRNRRDISSFLSKTEFDIGYLEISKNESFNLVDIKVEKDSYNLVFCIYMQEVATTEIKSFVVTAENWDKPEYRLSGLLYRQLTILNLNQWDLKPESILMMQLHIHQKILEHQINSVLKSDLKTMVIWDKLRVFLLIPLVLKRYDIQTILHFMQNTLDFEALDEFLTYLPDGEDSQVLINDIKTEIAQNETITEKIKSLLLYHVAKASFPGQENTQQMVIDSFSMVSQPLISSIYTQIRRKIFNKHLWDAQAYMETICSSPGDDVQLHEWLGTLNETSNQKVDFFPRKKRLVPSTDSGFFASMDQVEEGREKNPSLQQDDNILTAESMTSSAIRAEGWLNSLFKLLIEPFRSAVQKLLPRNHQPIVALAVENATAHHQPQSLDHCIPGVQYGGTYRKGITCYTKNMQMFIFPKNDQAKIASLEDNYSKQTFRPIECNGRPAVYFEGEKTNVFYIPEIPENPLDRLNDQLLLSQVLFHEAKKFYGWCKNFFTAKTKQPPLIAKESDKTIISNATKISWKQSLDSLEKQLIDINIVAGEAVDLRWINCILEDRREELDAMNQLSTVNLETINAFTENLQALQAELVGIREDLAVKQDRDFVCQTHNANGLTYKHYESNALFSRNKNNSVIPWGFFKGQCFKKEYNDNQKFYLSNNFL